MNCKPRTSSNPHVVRAGIKLALKPIPASRNTATSILNNLSQQFAAMISGPSPRGMTTCPAISSSNSTLGQASHKLLSQASTRATNTCLDWNTRPAETCQSLRSLVSLRDKLLDRPRADLRKAIRKTAFTSTAQIVLSTQT